MSSSYCGAPKSQVRIWPGLHHPLISKFSPRHPWQTLLQWLPDPKVDTDRPNEDNAEGRANLHVRRNPQQINQTYQTRSKIQIRWTTEAIYSKWTSVLSPHFASPSWHQLHSGDLLILCRSAWPGHFGSFRHWRCSWLALVNGVLKYNSAFVQKRQWNDRQRPGARWSLTASCWSITNFIQLPMGVNHPSPPGREGTTAAAEERTLVAALSTCNEHNCSALSLISQGVNNRENIFSWQAGTFEAAPKFVETLLFRPFDPPASKGQPSQLPLGKSPRSGFPHGWE